MKRPRGARLGEIAARVGLTYGAAHYHVRRPEQSGLVRVEDGDGLSVVPATAATAPAMPAAAASDV
ncbi:MAG: hypothetical protein V4510_09325 [bacterium]